MNITKPTLLLDKNKAIHNLTRMVDKAMQNRVRFRPHFKTHQSADIGEWFRAYGVDAITVSSLDMARYFADHGWKDITVAFPVNILEIETINQLAGDITLNLQVESPEVVQALSEKLTHHVNIWIKIDVGYNRTGIDAKDIKSCVALVNQINAANNMTFKGLLTHAGQTYMARSQAEIHNIYRNTVNMLKDIQKALPQGAELSIGDTPTCSQIDVLSDVDEIRPGNFIFYDLMQTRLGSCKEADIAVAVACPVVAKHPDRNQLVVYGGAVHLSKDFQVNRFGVREYGHMAFLTENGWSATVPDAHVSLLSQEHAVIQTDAATLEKVKVGDVVAILPIHSCLTVNLMRDFVVLLSHK